MRGPGRSQRIFVGGQDYQLGEVGTIADDYRRLPEPKDIGRSLSPEEELKLFETASSRPDWEVAFWISLVTANTIAGWGGVAECAAQ